MAPPADEHTIDMVLSFIPTITREEAIKLLNKTNGSLESAVDKYYGTKEDDMPALFQDQDNTGWDNSAFASGRYGEDSNSGGIPTFAIEYAPGVDHYPHSSGPSAAPTRPNSAASHRSGGQAGDAPRPSIENTQESGVVGGSGALQPYFGPARSEHNDTASWAMVTTSKSVEYIPDASIFHQSRDPYIPAFIKPLPNTYFLPALLTIFHTIPLYRNVLLASQVSIGDYWLGEDWWKGGGTATARTVDTTSGAGPSYELDLLYEVQRLMAFLDMTTRSYASLDSLFQLDAWTQSQLGQGEPNDLDDDALKFLMRWAWAYQQHVPDARLDGNIRSTINTGDATQNSFLLDAYVVPRGDNADLHLYDVLDDSFFDSPTMHAHIRDISNVLVLRLTASREGASIDCTIPSVLYADRYMESNRSAVDDMFAEKKQTQDQLTSITHKIEKVKFHKPQTQTSYTQPMEVLKMLKTSMKAFGPELCGPVPDPKHTAVLAQLETLYQRVEHKLSSLDQEKEKIQSTLNDIATRFRVPIDNTAQAGDHPYDLWGVATSALDYYIRHPDGANAMQWWHIKYSYEGEDASITRNTVTLDEVLVKARSESGKVLLVYANKAATSTQPVPLSASLEAFVEKDNVSLTRDLQNRQEEWPDYNPDDGNTVNGDWMDADWNSDDPHVHSGGYSDDYWNNVSAKKFHEQDSGVSSTTLTPNTEVDDGVNMTEMQEVSGGVSAWADGGLSNASSDALGAEPMDISEPTQPKPDTIDAKDVDMGDADRNIGNRQADPKVEHIETVEKKGG